MLDREFVLPHLLAKLARDDPDAIAMQDVDGHSATRRELHDTNLRWADAYRRLGVEPGEHVVTMLPNSFVAFHAWLGLCWLGATEVPTNTMYRGDMLRYLVTDSAARTIIISERYVDALAGVAAELSSLDTVVVPDATGELPALPQRVVRGDEFFADAQPADDFDGPDYWDVAAIIYTSGTTGPSKGVLMPWGTLWSFVTTTPDDFVAPGEGYYAMYPAFHVSGKAMLYQSAHFRARMVIREQFSMQHFWSDVREFGITGAGLVGPMAPFLMLAPEQPDDADSPLRHVMMGPLVPQVDEFRRRFGVEVGTGYGMTEIGAPFAVRRLRPGQQPELRQAAFRLGGLRGADRRRARPTARPRRGGRAGRARARAVGHQPRLLRHAGGECRGVAQRLVPHRRRVHRRRRRQLLLRRPHQGRDPPPRREHLVVRSRGAGEPASRCRRVGGAWRCRPSTPRTT